MTRAAVAVGAVVFLVAAALALGARARLDVALERALASGAGSALWTWTCCGLVVWTKAGAAPGTTPAQESKP